MSNPKGIGGFRKGPDPNRHNLTRAERRRGYVNAINSLSDRVGDWDAMAWVYYKVRGYYRARRRGQ